MHSQLSRRALALLQASPDCIKSLFPAIYALMDGEWPY